MRILLINTNPVVSRLLALCTRDTQKVLDEVKSFEEVSHFSYDVVFVDEASLSLEVLVALEGYNARKTVLLSFLQEEKKGFDDVIKKPFLPSQILDMLEEASIEEDFSDEIMLAVDEAEVTIKPKVLNLEEIDRIKELLIMEEETVIIDEAENYETRKFKVIQEEIVAQGVEIVGEDEMVEALSASVQEASNQLDIKLKNTRQRHKNKNIQFAQEHLDLQVTLRTIVANMKPKKMEKLLNGEEVKVKMKLEDFL